MAVLHLGMPVGNGADLIAEMRRASPSVGVLIISASLDAKNIEKATEACADEMLDKRGAW